MSPIRGSTTEWFLMMLRTMWDAPWCHVQSLPPLLCPKLYRLTPNRVLTAHTAYPTRVLTRLTSCNHANSSLPLAKHSTSSESPMKVKEGDETKEIVVEKEGEGTVVFKEAQKQPY